MTEQEKARERHFVVSTLVAMLVIIGGAIIWQTLNKPMTPQVIEFGDRYEVRWGNRFSPFVYRSWHDDGKEEVFHPSFGSRLYLPTLGYAPWHTDEVKQRFREGRIILDAHLHPEKVRKARLGGLSHF